MSRLFQYFSGFPLSPEASAGADESGPASEKSGHRTADGTPSSPGADVKGQFGASAAPLDGSEDTSEGSAGTATPEGEQENLKAELADSQRKCAETYDRMMRIAAEYDNSRKRWDKERGEVRQYAIQEFARDLLPVIDAFDKAMTAIESSGVNFETEEGKKVAAIVEGVQLVSKVFQDSLKKHGIDRLPGKGQPFNPMFHNAVARVVDSACGQETVIDEFVPGYKIGDRVLRTAMVRVATPD